MVRLVGGGAATRFENRVGDPAANPYLFMAGQICALIDGMENAIPCGSSADLPYQSEAPLLPQQLDQAVTALYESTMLRNALGDAVVNWFCHLKRAEWARFLQAHPAPLDDAAHTPDWEHREYFEMF
jgi:glutamine synthetase